MNISTLILVSWLTNDSQKKWTINLCQKIILGFIIVNCFCVSLAFSKPNKPYRILVTGFEPFGGYKKNPTEELVGYINSHVKEGEIDGCVIKGLTLPVTYFKSWEILNQHINNFKPDFVISLGYAPNSNQIRIESTANNNDEGFLDNDEKSHSGVIITNGPLRYKNALPIEKINDTLIKNGFSSYISNDAGGYLCNHIFYNLMHYGGNGTKMKAGFIHIPAWPVEGKKGLFEALKTVINVIKNNSIKVGVFEYEPIKNDVKQNLFNIERLIKDTEFENIGFYIFPEMALSGLIFRSSDDLLKNNTEYVNDKAVEKIKSIVKENKIYLGVGLVDIKEKQLYNSYQIFNPSGELILLYRKNHLYQTDFLWAKSGDSSYPIFESFFGKIGVLICHDIVYKESFRKYIQNNVNFLIIGTNWIGDRSIHHYLTNNDIPIQSIYISDRKGSEDNIKFHGNTSVIDGMEIYFPSTIQNKYNGLIYLHINR